METWYNFPAIMDDSQCWISYNHDYAELAETDSRDNVLVVRLELKYPDDNGVSNHQEYVALNEIEQALSDLFSDLDGVYVGRVTVDGQRYYYFYISIEESKATDLIDSLAQTSHYELDFYMESDPNKANFWEELYPSLDDWQVIQDLEVIQALKDEGDLEDVVRDIDHWAYFPDQQDCEKYKSWLLDEGYIVQSSGLDEDQEYLIEFSHQGSTVLEEIIAHTIKLNHQARSLEGRYDGWETTVESDLD